MIIDIKDITINKLRSGKFKKELPEFYELKNIIENNSWHNNESTFVHTIAVLKELQRFIKSNKDNKLKKYLDKTIVNYARKELLFLTTIIHDLGKKETIVKDGKISSFPEHEKISVVKAKKVLNRFGLSKREKLIIFGVIGKHSKLHSILESDNKKLKKQFQALKKSSKNYFVELLIMVMADTKSSFLKKTDLKKYNFRVNFYINELRKI